MKNKLLLILPMILFLNIIAISLMAQQQPALCKRTGFATKTATIECENGVTFTLSASAEAEAEAETCVAAQNEADILASVIANINLQ